MTTKARMTEREATSFDTFSMMNATIVVSERKCECQPYIDIFTYNRWKAQGFQVKRGEHGTHIQTFVPITKADNDGNVKVTGRVPKTSVVFCRCQVEKSA